MERTIEEEFKEMLENLDIENIVLEKKHDEQEMQTHISHID